MEEQRARQEAETGPGAVPAEGAAPETPGAAADGEDDPVLARALAMSVGGSETPAASAEPDLGAMTEDEQIAYAMRMSMQEEAAAAGGEAAEKMDVDETAAADKKDEDYSEAMNDPAFLQVREFQ
jgi:26S proteasome regulatory subunit N10